MLIALPVPHHRDRSDGAAITENVLETFFESPGTFAAGTHTNTPRS
jgi:hypothetical protein